MIKRMLKWVLAFVFFIILVFVLLVIFNDDPTPDELTLPEFVEQFPPHAGAENAAQYESLGSVMKELGQAANHIDDAIPNLKELDKLNNVQANIKSAADSSNLDSEQTLDMKGLDALDTLDGLSSLNVLDGLKPLEMKGLQGLANLAGSVKYIEPAEDAEKANVVSPAPQDEVSAVKAKSAENSEPDHSQTLAEPSAQAPPPAAGEE